ARRLDAVGGVGDLAGGLRRHQGREGRVAQAVGLDVGAQLFPVQVQRLGADGVQVALVGVDRQDALGVGGFLETGAGATFLGQAVGGLEQVILEGLEGAVGEGVGRAVGVLHAVL